jgi:hypothetical protein
MRFLISLIVVCLSFGPLAAEEESMESNERNCLEFVFYGIEGISLDQCSSIVATVIDETENEALRELLSSRATNMGLTLDRVAASNDGAVGGYCRVSSVDATQVFDVEPCRKELRECGEDGCIIDFYWPSGSRTVVQSRDESVYSAFAINGQRADLSQYFEMVGPDGPNDCSINYETRKLFCFSFSPYGPTDDSDMIVDDQIAFPDQSVASLSGTVWREDRSTGTELDFIDSRQVIPSEFSSMVTTRYDGMRYRVSGAEIAFSGQSWGGNFEFFCQISIQGNRLVLSRCGDPSYNGAYVRR